MPWDSCIDPGTDVATLACVPIVIQNVINAALVFSGLIALVLIIYSGVRYITSRGDEQKLADAKRTLTWALIGLVIIFLSFFIVGLISKITGVDQIAHPSL
jgi:hypothetical protein